MVAKITWHSNITVLFAAITSDSEPDSSAIEDCSEDISSEEEK